MGPGNKRGPRKRTGGGELNSSPPWKLYFNPWEQSAIFFDNSDASCIQRVTITHMTRKKFNLEIYHYNELYCRRKFANSLVE